MDKTKHLKTKYSLARYNLISQCEGDELRFYLYIKLYAINQNSAFPSQRAFKKDLGLSKYQTNRIAKKMEKKGRLKVKRSKGKNNIYDITWYDLTNDKSSQETLTQTNKNKTIRKKQVLSDKPTEWILEKEIHKLLVDPKRHIQVIGVWIKENKLSPENKEQMQSIITRNVRPAKLLNGYSNEQIIATIQVLRRTDYIKKFTPETVLKFIDKIVTQTKSKGAKIIKYEPINRGGKTFMKPIYAGKT